MHEGDLQKKSEKLFAWTDNDTIREKGFELKEERLRLGKTEVLHSEVDEALKQFVQSSRVCISLEVFRARLDESLSNLVY